MKRPYVFHIGCAVVLTRQRITQFIPPHVVIALVMLIWLGGAGCRPPRLCPDAIAPTPEEAALLMLHRRARNVAILGARDWQHGKVVLFEAEDPPGTTKLGFAVVQPRLGCGWVLRAQGMDQIALPPLTRSLLRVDGQAFYGMPLVMVYGHLLDPRISAVEVVFDNGTTRREMIQDGMFLLNEPTARVGCSLRLLDQQGQVLGQLDDLPARLFPTLTHTCPP